MHISLAQELRQLEYGQRLARRERNVLARAEGQSTGRQIFESALQCGARAMGLAHNGLQVRALADVVSLDAEHPALSCRGGDAWLDGWLFASDGRVVETVWSLGRKVVIDGRHIHRERLRAQFAAVMAKVLAV